MTSSSNGKQKQKQHTGKNSGLAQPLDQRLLNLDLKFFRSPVTGEPVRVDRATNEEFDSFIRQYVTVGWTLEERLYALVEAIQGGQTPNFLEPEIPGNTQFFTTPERASEGS